MRANPIKLYNGHGSRSVSDVKLFRFEGTAQQRIPADAAARPQDRWHFTIWFYADTHTNLLVRRG